MVYIDMEMPSKCDGCIFYEEDYEKCYLYSGWRVDRIKYDTSKKPEWCELKEPEIHVETNFYDQEDTIENCTVQILTNTVTGETSVGWWRNVGEEEYE